MDIFTPEIVTALLTIAGVVLGWVSRHMGLFAPSAPSPAPAPAPAGGPGLFSQVEATILAELHGQLGNALQSVAKDFLGQLLTRLGQPQTPPAPTSAPKS